MPSEADYWHAQYQLAMDEIQEVWMFIAAAFTTRILGEVPAVTWDGRWLAGRPDGYGRDDDDGRSTGPAIDLAPTGRRAAEFDQLRGP